MKNKTTLQKSVTASSVGNPPSRGRGAGSGSRGRGAASNSPQQHRQGRVFAITDQDAQASPDVVTGTLLIDTTEAHVLIDPGSTHSFVSLSYSMKLTQPLVPLRPALAISTLIGEVVIISSVFERCTVQIDGRELLVDLLPLCMDDFDVILGMD